MKILADASLPYLEYFFSENFICTTYSDKNTLERELDTHDVLLCRANLKITAELLQNSAIQCVATASSGIDHIDVNFLAANAISLFDAKGCNANAVADYVISTLACLSKMDQHIGRKAGIVGSGAIGVQVATRLQALNFEVISYDPPKRLQESNYQTASWEELMECDLICLHANLHDAAPYPSRHLFNMDALAALKPNVIIINASRGGIVDEDALLKNQRPIVYCTDVYSGEPEVDPRILKFATICTPHIAGYTYEAKARTMNMLSDKIHQHFNLCAPNALPYAEQVQIDLHLNWPDCVLDFYNPIYETQALKMAQDQSQIFLQQRKLHTFRHDFTFRNIS